MLEMDRLERQLVNLPLLQDPSSYIPDTVDLSEDALAREYWLYCFEEALDGVRGRASSTGLFINTHTLHLLTQRVLNLVAFKIADLGDVLWTGGKKSCGQPA